MIEFLKKHCQIYVINLDSNIDRLEHIDKELSKFNLTYDRFSAIKNEKFPMIGCKESHIQVLKQHNIKNVDKHCVVLEDDMFFDFKSPIDIIDDQLQSLRDWDMIFPYFFINGKYKVVEQNDFFKGATIGGHFYIVNINSINSILNNIQYIENNMLIDKIYISHIDRLYAQLHFLNLNNIYVNNKQHICQNIIFKSNISNRYHRNGLQGNMCKNKDDSKHYTYIDNIKLEDDILKFKKSIVNDILQNKKIIFRCNKNIFGRSLLKDGIFVNSWHKNECYYKIENSFIKFFNDQMVVTAILIFTGEKYIGVNFQGINVELIII